MNELILENDLSAIAARASADPAFLRNLPIDIIRAYKAPEAQIARAIRDNDARIAKAGSDLIDEPRTDFVWTSRIHFCSSAQGKVHETVERLRAEQKPKAVPGKTGPRFLLSSDGYAFAAVDLKTGEAFRGERLSDLPTYYDFLQPLAGIERYVPPSEQQADVDAARIMRELHDALVAHDASWRAPERMEALNVFLTRLLFCLFADGAGVFDAPATTDRPAVVRPFKRLMMGPASAKDGSGTAAVLTAAFRVLDMKDDDPRRHVMEPKVRDLPYANGRLFEADLPVPTFDRRARHALRRALDLDWSEINADIFGSMLQAVASDADRSHFGMHYTSVPNIMKVIGPLFVEQLRNRLVEARHDARKLRILLDDLAAIHVFDPACGSGNFLVIAYQSLRVIETGALIHLNDIRHDPKLRSRIRLDHFHGIDPVDFSCRTARLSLWISQINMDRHLVTAGLPADAILPLHDTGDIRCASALTLPWTDVVPADAGPTYIVGNPPYLGFNYQSPEQKREMDAVFSGRIQTWRNLDFVTAWFALAASHIAEAGSHAAFVTTSSVCQGEQVPVLWPHIKAIGVDIGFAHTSFMWSNSAAKNAGVACAIIGLQRSDSRRQKTIHVQLDGGDDPRHGIQIAVHNISPYLTPGSDLVVGPESRPINGLPTMTQGNQPIEGGNLILDRESRTLMLDRHPEVEPLIVPLMGSQEFIRNEERWCLWIEDGDLDFAMSIKPIAARINAVRQMRLASPRAATIASADRPHSFGKVHIDHRSSFLLMPRVSSESRQHLQCGIVERAIIIDSAFAVPNARPWLMAVCSTRMMAQWARTVGGRLESRIRFTNTMVYNTFPMPELTDNRIARLDDLGLRLIDVRQPHLDEGRTIGWLYGKDMPPDLREAHRDLDEEFESMYPADRMFIDDAERLEEMFRRYAGMKGIIQ